MTSVRILRAGFLGIVITLLSAQAWAQAAPALDVTNGCGSQAVGRHLMLLRDEQRSMTIDEVVRLPLSSRFERSTSEKPNFGFTSAAYWARLSLVNHGSTAANCLLELDYPSMDTIELFSPKESGGFETRKLGDQEAFAARTIKHRNPVFELLVPPQSTQVLTLRLSTSGSMQISLRLHDPREFFRLDHESQMAMGIYCGLMLVMALYNLFLFFSIRDRAYLVYVGFVLSIATANLSLNGVTYEYFLGNSPVLANKIVLLSMILTGLFGSIFTSQFLKINSEKPTIHRFFIALIIYFIALLPLAIFGPYALAIRVGAVSAGVWPLPLFFYGIYAWKVRGYAPARFYVLAWTPFLVGSTMYSLRSLGYVPNVLATAHAIEIGSAVEVVLLSFALADRIKLLEGEKNAALTARLTDQEHAEAIQREAAHAWQSTFDAIGSGVCLLDNKGKILRANQASNELLSQREESIVGAQLSHFLKEALKSQRSGRSRGFEIVSEREENFIEFRHRWYSVRHDPIRDANAIPTGSVHIMTDVTAQRELEQQLYHAQKMDAIGRLAGGVAHDFNNLLAVIISYGEFLMESAPNPEAAADALEIVKAGHRAAGLTRQLLVFSRKQTLKASAISPNDVVHDLVKMLSRLIGENHKLRLQLCPERCWVYFDNAQFEQILVNLVVNARDAMQGSGDIIIETECLELLSRRHVLTEELPAGRYVTLCVSDSGMGMDNKTLAHIFEPFFTTKGPGKGTGLGLAMVYGSVHQGGGFIDVTSKVGKGTKLTVYLPRVEETAGRSSAPPAGKKQTGQGQTVLVVEDEAPVRAAVCKILTAVGFQVFEAPSAEAAVAVLEQMTKPPDLLLTDIVMSGMTGVELVTTTAERYPRMKVLYMSGYGFDALSEQGIDPATVRVLAKPFTRQELLIAISNANEEDLIC